MSERQKIVGLSKIKKVFSETVQEINSAEIPLAASSLSYTTILSVIPLIAVSFSIFKAFGGLEKFQPVIETFIFENLAEGSDKKTLELFRSFVSNIHAGTLGVTGFFALLITSMSMLSSIDKSINRVWGTNVKRSFFQRITSYWFFVTLGPVVLAFAMGLTRILHPEIAFALIFCSVFFSMYFYIPNTKVHPYSAVLGAIWSTLLWDISRYGYNLYVQKVVTYNKIYGSLGAVPILMLWIYIAWLIVLSGAALSSTLQKKVFQYKNERVNRDS